MKTINQILTVVAAVLLAAITGCAAQGGDSPAKPPSVSSPFPSAGSSTGAADAIILIEDFKFEVPTSVRAGAMMTVTNRDSAPHTLTAKDKGGFNIEVPGGGTVIFQAPDGAGEYQIICTFHPQMNATLVVQ